ncbi:hypothetical protein BLL52_0607 [Rhodoferax antarcticus ANT.BR]|uniref:Uncharacterized protein n=1 Tax=Rhodoferax antarcticus ANT.BR TaxID=1111071 RepID=A0A1Q8YK61_9BURK|nr:hypothetical protein BLL52_0607 [Rhodoferax antarcticus ANT.BR]
MGFVGSERTGLNAENFGEFIIKPLLYQLNKLFFSAPTPECDPHLPEPRQP